MLFSEGITIYLILEQFCDDMILNDQGEPTLYPPMLEANMERNTPFIGIREYKISCFPCKKWSQL